MFYGKIAKLAAAASVLALVTLSSARAETVSSNLRNELWQAVANYVDTQSGDGAYLVQNPVSDQVLIYDLSEAFTLVVQAGENFVLCSSFQTPEGKTTYMDFLIDRSHGEARVVDVFTGRRSITREMVEAHKLNESKSAAIQ